MGLDGADADAKLAGNFLIALPFGNQGQHFTLPPGEPVEWLLFSATVDELVEGGAGYFRTEEWLAGANGFDGAHQFLRRRPFGHIAVGAGLDDSKNVLPIAVHREHQHLDFRGFLAQQFSDYQSVHPGHADVHQHDVRPQLAGLAQGLVAIGSLADDFQALLASQADLETFAHHGMVVHHQYFDFLFAHADWLPLRAPPYGAFPDPFPAHRYA